MVLKALCIWQAFIACLRNTKQVTHFANHDLQPEEDLFSTNLSMSQDVSQYAILHYFRAVSPHCTIGAKVLFSVFSSGFIQMSHIWVAEKALTLHPQHPPWQSYLSCTWQRGWWLVLLAGWQNFCSAAATCLRPVCRWTWNTTFMTLDTNQAQNRQKNINQVKKQCVWLQFCTENWK